ncbi:hypothetical protein THRCLA_21072 [Thraustotheca clavata]|uniref:Multidrug/Oligosaccharidyl-lipid/Polysaccharide (MOP) Flippase Superfamily n=1 Tax=Thraustotheca clavata TaxID=74557 RepID=A0A1W0A0I2_9STRA|nr:hypothetical protein THRCLA_21072 [Thraustotheca clavata]
MSLSEASKLLVSPLFQYEDGIHVIVPVHREISALIVIALRIAFGRLPRVVIMITTLAFVGHLGTQQLAGMTLASIWMGFPSNFLRSALQGVGTLCSQAQSAGNDFLVGTWLQTAIVATVLWTIPTVIWYHYIGDMMALSVSDAATIEYGKDYASVAIYAIIPQCLLWSLKSFFESQEIVVHGCTFIAMLFNFGFNQIFIYGGLGYKGYGFIGSAYAIVASLTLELLLYAYYAMAWNGYHRPYWGGWTFECIDRDNFYTFLAVTMPKGLIAAMDWTPYIVIGVLAGYLGPAIVAAQGILLGLFALVVVCIDSFANAIQNRMAVYLIQGCIESARRLLTIGVFSVILLGLTFFFLIAPFIHDILRLWTVDDNVLTLCSSTVSILIYCAIATLARAIFTATLTAASLHDYAELATLLARWCVFLPLSLFLPIYFHWGIEGFWLALLASDLFQVVYLACGVSRLNWQVAIRRIQYLTPVASINNISSLIIV